MSGRLMVAGLLMVASRGVAAQETALFIPNDREANAQVAKIVTSAEAAGLPTNSIVGLVQYGLSVPRAKPSAIVAAARAVATQLEVSRAALAPNATPSEIEAGVNALRVKATPDVLRAVRRASGARPVVVPLGVLTQLLSSDVPLPRAQQIVTDLIRRNATPNQLVALGNDVAADVALGTMTPEAAIDLRARYLIAVLAAPGGAAPAMASDAQTVSAPSLSSGGTGPRQTPPPRSPRP